LTRENLETIYEIYWHIDNTAKDDRVGTFCSLQEAYEQGLLTTNDLRSIAYYYSLIVVEGGSNNPENFVPTPKNCEVLTGEVGDAVLSAFVNEFQKQFPSSDITASNTKIANYFGTYGKCIIVGARTDAVMLDFVFVPEQIIGEVLFRNFCSSLFTIYVVIT